MKLRAYLVDDEPLALERLARMLEKSGRVEVIGSATEPEKAVREIGSKSPDLLFLDIQMPRLNGFDVLARLAVQPIVIFTTAYDSYALQAFAVNSIDYLLKPIDPERLERALDKIEGMRNTEALKPDWALLLDQITQSLQRAPVEYPERIASRLGDRLWFVDLKDVSHFFAKDKLTYAAVGDKTHCVDATVQELEKRLDPRKFFRIHRSTLLNLSWVREVSTLPGGGLNVRLKGPGGSDLQVARDRVREFKTRINC
jgi:two-component system LytT family response regulator